MDVLDAPHWAICASSANCDMQGFGMLNYVIIKLTNQLMKQAYNRKTSKRNKRLELLPITRLVDESEMSKS